MGVLTAMIHWESYFRNVLPQSIQGIVVVLEYHCGASEMENQPEQATNQRRMKKGDTKKTTFTIIDVSDFSVVTQAPTTVTTSNNYWNVDAHTPPPVTSNSYWDVDAHSTPPPTPDKSGNPYCDEISWYSHAFFSFK